MNTVEKPNAFSEKAKQLNAQLLSSSVKHIVLDF
jgi:hypothetical protein